MLGGIAACDTAPGVAALDREPPIVSDLVYSPEEIIFEELPDDQLIADTLARVPFSVSVNVRSFGLPVDSVFYSIRTADNRQRLIASGIMANDGGDRFVMARSVDLRRSDAGPLSVKVQAVSGGVISNQAIGTTNFVVLYIEPPTIEDVEAPDTVQLSPSETVVFRIMALVSHPDGLAAVREVTVRNQAGTRFQMCDDGGEGTCGGQPSGDDDAGDGWYTRAFRVTPEDYPGAPEGEYAFVVRALSRGGSESQEVPIVINFVK